MGWLQRLGECVHTLVRVQLSIGAHAHVRLHASVCTHVVFLFPPYAEVLLCP